MKENLKSSDTTKLKKGFKNKFSLWELYCALVFLPGAVSRLAKNNKSKLVNKDFVERLQLAVTEVNGCPACSYQHTKIALRQGMSNEEIASFLSGGDQFIKTDEAKAIMFAQHFAESRGIPKKYTYDSIVKEYGKGKSDIILSAVQIMIAGNMYGIPYSAFQSRLKGEKYKDSTLFYELGMLLGGIILLPIAIIQGIIKNMLGLTNERFDKNVIDE